MAANFTQSIRKYSVALGGYDYTPSFGSVTHKRLVCNYTETTTVTRALTSCAADDSGITMAQKKVALTGGLNPKYATFEYEKSRKVSDCQRTSEAGFFTKTTVVTICDSISEITDS